MGGSIRIVYVHAQPRVFMNDEKAVRECARSEHRRFENRTGKSRLHRVHGVSKRATIRESSWSVSSFFLQERPPKQAPDGVLTVYS